MRLQSNGVGFNFGAELRILDEGPAKRIRVYNDNSNASALALVDVMCSGGSTLVYGNREELLIWKSYLTKTERGKAMMASGNISFRQKKKERAPCRERVYERIVSTSWILAEAKKIYFCSLMFSDRLVDHRHEAFDAVCRLSNFLSPPEPEQSFLYFCHRVCSSVEETTLDFECVICARSCLRDIVLLSCRHRLCQECFARLKETSSRCPFCRDYLLAFKMINPLLPTVQELVDHLLATKNPREWIVLCRGARGIDKNLLLTRLSDRRGGERRKTPSRAFSSPYYHDLSCLKGLIYEEGWCLDILIQRIIKMMSNFTKKKIQIICLRLNSSTPVETDTHSFL